MGRLATRNDAAGLASFDYDERGNLLNSKRWTGGGPNTSVYYAYDNASRLYDISYPSGLNVSYFRDAAGNVNSVAATPPGVGGFTMAWLYNRPFGPEYSTVLANGITESRTYDLDYRLTNITAANGSSTQFENLTWITAWRSITRTTLARSRTH